MRRSMVVFVALLALAACSPNAAGAPGGEGVTVDLPAETMTWCGEHMRAVYKAATEINVKPRLEELDRQVLAAGLEGREIAADIGTRLRDEWIAADGEGFSRACQRAFGR
jgi:hypothetical protein